jgi:hypothetical protein
MEAIYDDVAAPVGMQRFAPAQPARASMFSARSRLGVQGESVTAGPYTEEQLYP